MRALVERSFIFVFALLATYSAASYGTTLPSMSQTPLFLSQSVKNNLMFVIDDSGSMDSEMELPTPDGTYYQEYYGKCYVYPEIYGTNYYTGTGLCNDSRYYGYYTYDTRVNYGYVFPAPVTNKYDGNNLYSWGVTPPLPAFAFTRSSSDNKMYYDPTQTYTPWPSRPGKVFPDSNPTNAPRDPEYTASSDPHLDLTQDQSAQFTYAGTKGGTAKSPIDQLIVGQTLTYYPATYYVITTSGSYTGVDSAGDPISNDCDTPKSSDFDLFEANPSQFSFQNNDAVALNMEGKCLKKVEIKNNGDTYNGMTYSQAIQNFANWFTYYRKRHLAMRGAVARSIEGIAGMNVGMFWLNKKSSPVEMYDVSDTSVGGGLDTLLSNHYQRFDGIQTGEGTPLRSALNFAGQEYERSTTSGSVAPPITQACQKNFSLIFTDGYASLLNVPNVGNVDGSAGTPYADSWDNTLGDIAYKYWDNNLRTDLTKNKVPVPQGCSAQNPDPQLDCNKFLHMNTYVVGLGAVGNLFGVNYNKVADAYANPPTWPDPASASDGKAQIDDLYHAAVDGHGEAYSVSSSKGLADGLSSAIANIQARTGSASAVTFNTATIKSDALIFSAEFNSSNWTGDLVANSLNSNNGQLQQVNGSYVGNVVWDAANKLDSSSVSASSRKIVTYNGSQGQGVPFTWSNLDTTEQSDFLAGNVGTTEAQERLQFIRGDRSQEGQLFRKRGSRLGDIVHSSPVYISSPNMAWPDTDPFGTSTDRYTNFKAAESNRTPVIYVGANDGMLHAFNASSGSNGGDEIFGYIPSTVYSSATGAGLHYLSEKNYNHRYYVDLTPSVGDVYLTDSSGTGAWHSLLVGGLRSGGKGLFAIDVTHPSQFTSEASIASKVQWEFTPSMDNRLGYLTGPVQFAMMKVGNSYKWELVFGNGYDPGTGETGLFMVDLDAAYKHHGLQPGDWQFIDLGAGDGLVSNVRLVDTNGDHVVDRIYASDYDGHVWAIDASSSGTWGSAYTKGNTPEPLFSATDTNGNPQPIQAPPIVYRNNAVTSSSSNDPNLLVAFGTGQYLTANDPSNTQVQSFYSVWDHGTSQLTRSDLTSRQITDTTVSGVKVRDVSGSPISWGSTSGGQGWYMDFDTQKGERVTQPASLRNETLFFNTMIPSTAPCDSGGSSVEMFLNLDGTQPSRNVFDTNGDGLINSGDVNAAGFFNQGGLLTPGRVLGDVMFESSTGTVDTSGNYLGGSRVDLGSSPSNTGRLGWHQIIQ